MSTWSKSSPPKWVSPFVALTSKTPSPTSRMLMSNVPPPRSKTAIFSFFFLSRPYARLAAVGSSHPLLGLFVGLWILDFPLGVEAGDLGGVDGRLPLRVVE